MNNQKDDSGSRRPASAVALEPNVDSADTTVAGPAPQRARARKKKGPAAWRPQERVSDRFWRGEIEPGATLQWRDRCAADRARRTAGQLTVDYILQRRARMDAVRTFSWYLQEGVDNGHQQLERYWPGWAAIAQ